MLFVWKITIHFVCGEGARDSEVTYGTAGFPFVSMSEEFVMWIVSRSALNGG